MIKNSPKLNFSELLCHFFAFIKIMLNILGLALFFLSASAFKLTVLEIHDHAAPRYVHEDKRIIVHSEGQGKFPITVFCGDSPVTVTNEVHKTRLGYKQNQYHILMYDKDILLQRKGTVFHRYQFMIEFETFAWRQVKNVGIELISKDSGERLATYTFFNEGYFVPGTFDIADRMKPHVKTITATGFASREDLWNRAIKKGKKFGKTYVKDPNMFSLDSPFSPISPLEY